jgi:protein-S-isoprenylcysteine O-methyltransferase Ste14
MDGSITTFVPRASLSDVATRPDAPAPRSNRRDDAPFAPANVNARPTSASRGWVCGLGFIGFAIGLATVPRLALEPVAQLLFLMAMVAGPMLAAEILVLKVHRRASTGLDWSRAPDFNIGRSLVKLAGLGGTLLAIAFIYWLLPEYQNANYALFFDFAATILAYLVIPAALYVFVIDAYMVEPRDGYWHAGQFFLGKSGSLDRAALTQYALGWLVKAFFLPLMLPDLSRLIGDIFGSIYLHGAPGFIPFFDWAWSVLFAIDLTFTSIGYLLASRFCDTHIRSAEPTLQGWVIALICYMPFWSLIEAHYLPYGAHAMYWGTLLHDHVGLQIAWGGTILSLLAIYACATMSFGCRFSNLTHRGVITNGPYRWTKHPAYIAKNLSWWMVALPFASSLGLAGSLRGSIMLLIVNGIYFLRARTEERHLSRDPDYVAYALWMNEHGALRPLATLVPFLRYRAPAPSGRPRAA